METANRANGLLFSLVKLNVSGNVARGEKMVQNEARQWLDLERDNNNKAGQSFGV